MSSSKSIQVSLACEIAGIDRDRFNEHVAAGNLPCAPSTRPGRARRFEPADILALTLFQTMLNEGLPARDAGMLSCAVFRAAKRQPFLRFIAYIYTSTSPPYTVAMAKLAELSTWETDPYFQRALIFDVDKIRREIIKKLSQAD